MTERNADYEVETAVDGEDQIIAIKPPVENTFLEDAYDMLEEMGLIKEIVVRDSFFKTQYLRDGRPYSELRMSGTALRVAGQRLISMAHQSADLLRDQQKTANVSPDLIPIGGSRMLFQGR